MARIPYGDENKDLDTKALAEQIRKERGGKLLNLYRMLLNSPPVARGWLNLLTAVRQQTTLAGRYREMAIIRVAFLNGAEYEYKVHQPFAIREGMSREEVDAIADWKPATVFTPMDRAVLAYTDAMTEQVQVSDEAFAAVTKHFDSREMTELTATIAAYNLVSRFLEALQVDPEASV
jgi:alkylhydroperoxidase family enzyme